MTLVPPPPPPPPKAPPPPPPGAGPSTSGPKKWLPTAGDGASSPLRETTSTPEQAAANRKALADKLAAEKPSVNVSENPLFKKRAEAAAKAEQENGAQLTGTAEQDRLAAVLAADKAKREAAAKADEARKARERAAMKAQQEAFRASSSTPTKGPVVFGVPTLSPEDKKALQAKQQEELAAKLRKRQGQDEERPRSPSPGRGKK